MAKQTTKEWLLNDIRTEHRRLERHLAALGPQEMLQSGVCGDWSVMDILAHLSAWEQLFLDWYRAGVRGIAPTVDPVGMSRKRMAALNQQIYQANRSRGLEEVLAGFDASYREILAVIEVISEGEMFAPGCYAWTGALTLADYIAGNTCCHYAWARGQIRRWAKRETAGEN